jgi:cytoskeleton protein RodZ
MSNKDQSKDKDQKNGTDRSPPVGALLRASRLRVGEDLRQVSDILCIRYLYLEAIENCRYADLPSNTYAVGFIRSYAGHLGLDGDEVVRRYRAEQVGKKSATDLAFPTPVQDSGVPKGAIVFVGVLIALVVYGGWYVTTTDESILTDLISPVPDHLKHLVNRGDAPGDAPQDTDGTSPVKSRPIPGQEAASKDVEKVVRETTAAAQQMANAAGQDAQRTAEAAAVAATTETAEKKPAEPTAEATTQATTAPTNTTPASTSAAAISESAPKVVPETAAANTGQSTVAPLPVEKKPAPAPAPKPAVTPAPVSEPATAPVATAPTTAPKQPVVQTPAERKPAPAAIPAPVAEQPATPATQGAPAAAPTTEATPAPTESAALTVTEPVKPATKEVTAEDLNSLVLRQATGVAGSPQAGAAVAAEPATTTNPSGIVIRASGSSWVEIRNSESGAIIFTGLMNDGKSFVVPDIKGLTLDTGNAGALKITVDGKAVPEIGSIGAVRKNVSLDAARLKAGTAVTR